MVSHTVQQGECVNSIAASHGFFWETIWKASENLDLRQERTNPNHLLPGDELVIPDRRAGDEPVSTEQKHRFRCKVTTAVLKLRLLDNGVPRRNEAWTAEVDGRSQRGTTSADGEAEIRLDPRAPSVTLRLESGVEYELALRALDPIDTDSGVRGRLTNLGYECGALDAGQSPLVAEAIRQFQADHGLLDVNGRMDDTTRAELKEVYGS